ncbi:MAG: hypothetical protein KA712_12270 [Myxococcales bacterium]|nr:hypothetical protein [Myxococcales bacterium]
MKASAVAVAGLLLFAPSSALAVAPLLVDGARVSWSQNRRYIGVLDWERGATDVYAAGPVEGQELVWQANSWFQITPRLLWRAETPERIVYVSNDGRFLLSVFGSDMLEPEDGDPVLVRIVPRAGKAREWRLSTLLKSPDALPSYSGVRRWGWYVGLREDAFVLETCEGRRLALPLEGGMLLDEGAAEVPTCSRPKSAGRPEGR